MTLRNRNRNEKILAEQFKQQQQQQQPSVVPTQMIKHEKKSSNSQVKTRALSANPPSSSASAETRKNKPKIYKDIFNEEEIKNQNNFVSSSPISNCIQSKRLSYLKKI